MISSVIVTELALRCWEIFMEKNAYRAGKVQKRDFREKREVLTLRGCGGYGGYGEVITLVRA